jgi:hypothetical protein
MRESFSVSTNLQNYDFTTSAQNGVPDSKYNNNNNNNNNNNKQLGSQPAYE